MTKTVVPRAPLYGDEEIPPIVRNVLLFSSSSEPERVSERLFNQNRAAAGYPDLKAAHKLCEQLGMSWLALKATACKISNVEISIGQQRASRHDVGTEECRTALQVAALAQRRTSLSPVDYEVWLRDVQQKNATRYRHGGRRPLPTSFQIAHAFGGWDAALEATGLEPRPAPHFQEPRMGIPIIQILEWGLELYGALANTHQSELLARTQKIPYPRRDRPWSAYVDELRASRAERGLWTPAAALPPKLAPNYGELAPGQTEPLGTTLGLRRAAADAGWTREECVEAFIRFLDDLPKGWSASQDHYQEWTAGRDDEPWPKAFIRHGGFAAIREEARRERRKRLIQERGSRGAGA